MIVGTYKKKSGYIEALQFTGLNHSDCEKFIEGNDMRVSKGDYIIKGVDGEFYPCKPDIFAKTYDLIFARVDDLKELGQEFKRDQIEKVNKQSEEYNNKARTVRNDSTGE